MDSATTKACATSAPYPGTRIPPRRAASLFLPTLLKSQNLVKRLILNDFAIDFSKTGTYDFVRTMFFSASKRFEQLEDDLRKTMTEVKSLRVEWDETYEKLLKLYRKTAAERAKLEKQDSPEEATVTAQTPENGHSAGGFLSPKQKIIQQQILARRQAMR